VHAEVCSLWLSLALAAAVAYAAVNPSLVAVWAGSKQFGGILLTVLLAAQMIVMGRAQVLYFLYRAAGAIVPGSMLQFWESMLRFGLMVVLVKMVGIAGPALATLLVAFPVSQIALHRTRALIGQYSPPAARTPRSLVGVRIALCVVGVALCALAYRPSWLFVLGVGGILATVAGAAQLMLDPRLARVSRPFLVAAARVLPFLRIPVQDVSS
jgi:O-antigen/teichoic acid export membrane protein